MKTYYTVITQFMNGTVTRHIDVASFTSKELAEKTKKAIEIVNSKSENIFTPMSYIEETKVYESDVEVPILGDPIYKTSSEQ